MNQSVDVSDVNYENGKTIFSSVLCQPDQPGEYPGIIAIHGIFGLQDMDVNFAKRLATQGYVVLVHGWQSNEQDPSDQSIKEGIKQAILFLKQNARTDQDRIGLVGFCRGGSIAMIAAADNEELKLSVSFYGQAYYPYPGEKKPNSPIDLADKIQMPILLIHGKEDAVFDFQESVDFCSALKSLGKVCEYKLFPGAGHGFFLKGHRNYDQQASEHSWTVLSDFLNKYI